MRWTIRNKVIICLALLMTIIGTLAFSGFQGVYSYRRLARSISQRAEEIPLAEKLIGHTKQLRNSLESYKSNPDPDRLKMVRQFEHQIQLIASTMEAYETELHGAESGDLSINDTERELEVVHEIRTELANAKLLPVSYTHLTLPTTPYV